MARPHLEKSALAAATSADVGARSLPAGKSALLERLYREYSRDLARYIGAKFGAGPPEPEEVAQAAFAKLAGLNDIGELSNPRGYLYTTACNIVIDHHRRSSHRDAVHRDLSAQASESQLSEFSPERVLLGKEQLALFMKALEAMPKLRRRIFLMMRADGCSAKEVGRRFGMKEDTVYRHVSRALQDCAAAFEKAEQQR